MAEGTRLRELDTRLSTHESKLSEFLEGLTKTRAEVTQQVTEVGVKMDKRLDAVGVRIDKLNKNFLEIKQLLLGMQSHHRPLEPGSLVDTSIGSSAMFITHPTDIHTVTFFPSIFLYDYSFSYSYSAYKCIYHSSSVYPFYAYPYSNSSSIYGRFKYLYHTPFTSRPAV